MRNIYVETPLSQIDVTKSKRTTGHRVLKTTLHVVGGAVFLVATAYALAHDGPRNGNINSGANKSKPGDIKNPLNKHQDHKKNIRLTLMLKNGRSKENLWSIKEYSQYEY